MCAESRGARWPSQVTAGRSLPLPGAYRSRGTLAGSAFLGLSRPSHTAAPAAPQLLVTAGLSAYADLARRVVAGLWAPRCCCAQQHENAAIPGWRVRLIRVLVPGAVCGPRHSGAGLLAARAARVRRGAPSLAGCRVKDGAHRPASSASRRERLRPGSAASCRERARACARAGACARTCAGWPQDASACADCYCRAADRVQHDGGAVAGRARDAQPAAVRAGARVQAVLVHRHRGACPQSGHRSLLAR